MPYHSASATWTPVPNHNASAGLAIGRRPQRYPHHHACGHRSRTLISDVVSSGTSALSLICLPSDDVAESRDLLAGAPVSLSSNPTSPSRLGTSANLPLVYSRGSSRLRRFGHPTSCHGVSATPVWLGCLLLAWGACLVRLPRSSPVRHR